MYGCTGWKRTLDKIKGCFLYSGGDAEWTFRIFLVCVVFVSAIKKSFLRALSTIGWWGERTSIHKENIQTQRWLIKHRKCGIQRWLRCFGLDKISFDVFELLFYLFNFPQVLTRHNKWNTSETCTGAQGDIGHAPSPHGELGCADVFNLTVVKENQE